MRGLLAALLLVLASAALAAPLRLDMTLDARLDRLVLLAYDKPAESLQALQALRRELAGRHAEQLLMAEAQILVQGGQVAAAEKLATALAVNPQQRGRVDLLRAQIAERGGRNQEAAAAAEAALTELEPPCAGGGLAERVCDFRMAWAALRILEREQISQGALAQAAAVMRQALDLARGGGDTYMSAISMGALGLLNQELDQPEEARRLIAAALELAQGDPQAMARSKVMEARIAVRRGDKQTQLQSYEEALAFAGQAGARRLQAQIKVNLVDLHMHNARPAQALQLARQALPVLLEFKDVRLERTLRHNTAVVLLQLKQFDAARREIARAQELAAGQPDPARSANELRELGHAWAAAGQPREAIAVFHAERKIAAQIQARNREAQLLQLELKYDSGRKQRDLDLLTRDKALKDQQLANRSLATRVGIAVGVLLSLSLLLAAVMLKRVQAANKRLKANELLLRAQSERDPLTDLANRRHFLAVMQQRAHDLFEGGLLMVDIDHFKHVNDRHGHAAGDVVIREVARRISEAVRQDDLVVRWGGEEFLIFAPNVPQEQLQLLAQRILASVGSTPVDTEAGALRTTVSIGYAHFPLPPGQLRLHWEQAVNWADMALYSAKAQGRNCAMGIVTVDASDTEALLQIEADFDAACSSQRVSLQRIAGPQ